MDICHECRPHMPTWPLSRSPPRQQMRCHIPAAAKGFYPYKAECIPEGYPWRSRNCEEVAKKLPKPSFGPKHAQTRPQSDRLGNMLVKTGRNLAHIRPKLVEVGHMLPKSWPDSDQLRPMWAESWPILAESMLADLSQTFGPQFVEVWSHQHYRIWSCSCHCLPTLVKRANEQRELVEFEPRLTSQSQLWGNLGARSSPGSPRQLICLSGAASFATLAPKTHTNKRCNCDGGGHVGGRLRQRECHYAEATENLLATCTGDLSTAIPASSEVAQQWPNM